MPSVFRLRVASTSITFSKYFIDSIAKPVSDELKKNRFLFFSFFAQARHTGNREITEKVMRKAIRLRSSQINFLNP